MEYAAEAPKSNGNNLWNRFVGVVMTILTVVVTGTFGFLWGMNADFARMQEREIEKDKKIDAIQIKLNQMQLDQQQQKENVIRLDVKLERLLDQKK